MSSIAVSAHKGLSLPLNVDNEGGPGLLHVRIDRQNPLPFNKGTGNLIIASLWNENEGLLRFHSSCDGKAHVEISTGKYSGFSNKDIALGLDF